ncbi:MAG: HEAT repeat domain-containing protein [Acidimicrobiia bacterium]|nr:HEAT repeat domain-containing protein [Acidimicrobiia bacterium]
MGFKEDADFARFVSMGAVGTAAVARNLRDQHGHAPIELERYAMANKVWQTKVKRLRLPDLACVRCGRRVESRAKSKLGIILSHSDTPGREWHAGGMRPDDWYAFLKADLSVFPAHAGSPTYFTTGALTASVGGAKRSAPKAASEGSEVTLTWPAWVPGRSGWFRGVDDEGRIVCEWEDGRTTRYWQWRNWPEPRYTYLDPGDSILGEESIVAGVVAAASELGCPGELWDLASDLGAPDAVDRYAAIKAVGATNRVDLAPRLARTTEHPEEDWRVRVEAYGSLARLQPEAWTDQLQELAADPEGAAEQHMEAVFVLSEIPTEEAATALATVASNRDLAVEVRSASAWGLGQGAALPSPPAAHHRRRRSLLSRFTRSLRSRTSPTTSPPRSSVGWRNRMNDGLRSLHSSCSDIGRWLHCSMQPTRTPKHGSGHFARWATSRPRSCGFSPGIG